jgi:hypothetical protein
MKIGIVLPTRNRPERARRAVASLMERAAKPDRVTVFLGVDADEEASIRAFPDAVVYPREITMAINLDKLSEHAEARSDIVMRMDDDLVMTTGNWDEAVEGCVGDQFGIWHPDDPKQAGPDFCSLAVMSSRQAAWLRAEQGFVHAYFFPFWFADTWLDEVGDMAGMKACLPVLVDPPEGKGNTHGLREIAFWAEFFDRFRGQRKEVARRLIEAAYPQGILKAAALSKLKERESVCAIKTRHLKSPQFISQFEARAEAETDDARYAEARRKAEGMMAA